MLALRDNINKFESIHGPIKTVDEVPSGGGMMPLSFGPTSGMA